MKIERKGCLLRRIALFLPFSAADRGRLNRNAVVFCRKMARDTVHIFLRF